MSEEARNPNIEAPNGGGGTAPSAGRPAGRRVDLARLVECRLTTLAGDFIDGDDRALLRMEAKAIASVIREIEQLIHEVEQSEGSMDPTDDSRVAGLLSNAAAITSPDFHSLNRHTERNDRLLHAVLCAYAKHHLDFAGIGWDQLGDILMSVICNEIGDDAFIAWGEMITRAKL